MNVTKLKEVRQKNGVSVTWLSEQLGVHRATLTNYEKGATPVPKSILFMAAQLLHVPLSDLLPDLPVSSSK